MISEDLEVFFGTMEVVSLPGPVGLTDAKRQKTRTTMLRDNNLCVELAGRTTSVTALRNRIIVGSGTLEDFPRSKRYPDG